MPSAMDVDFLQAHDFCVAIAIRAGAYLRGQAASRAGLTGQPAAMLSATIKMSSVDIVTEADMESERMISEAIRERYPDHQIIGEESYSAGQEKRFMLTEAPTWVVDPLDGTVNYLHLFPQFCISIALVVNKLPVVGAIYAPFVSGISSHPQDAQNGTLYSAASGLGAFLTTVTPENYPHLLDPPMRASSSCKPTIYSAQLPLLKPAAPFLLDAPKGCLFAAEWGKDRRDRPDGNLTKKVNSMWNMACEIGGRDGKGGLVHGVRSLGSAALDMAYVATGAVDIFWEAGCWEWDIAAGACILHEAGGFMYSAQPSPGDDDPDTPLPMANLGGRLYLAIRPCSGTSDETSKQAQDRVAREIWRRVEVMDYKRPMLAS